MTLAEKLRWLDEAKLQLQVAQEALAGTPAGLWDERDRSTYLRGYDDAKAEMDPYIAQLERRNEELEMHLRESNDEIANAKARVRELEAQLAAQPQPAAVGVVGSVRYGVKRDRDGVLSHRAQFSRYMAEHDMEKHKTAFPHETFRIVAIVDPAQIVPLASAEPLQRSVDNDGLLYWKADKSVRAWAKLYVGAQPAQERGA